MRTSDRSARADRAWQCPAAIAVTLATGALYALVAFVSIELTRDGGRLAAVWLPNALALAVLLRGPAGREGALLGSVLLGNIAAAVIVGDGLVKALTLAACNVLELAVALILIRRACRPFAVMKRIDHLTRFVASAGLAAPAVSATLATLALGLEDQLVPALWGHWFVAHSLGMIVVTPAALIIFDAISAPRLPTRREVARWAALTVGGAGVAAGVFIQDGYPLLFLIAPVVVLHAFVLGSLGTAISVLMIAAVATVCTWQGSGPINLVAGPLAERLMVLQAFIASAFAIGLPVAAVLSGKRRVVALLEKRSARLRLLSQAISDAVLRFDAQGQCTYASPSVRAVLGLAPELLLGRRASERAHPQARMAIAQAEARLLGGVSERERITYRRFADDEHGNAVFIVADAVLVRDEPGGAIDGIVVCLRDATERVALERALAWTERRLAEAGANRADFVAGMGSAIRARVEQMQVAALQLAHAERNAPGRRETEEIAAAGGRLLRLISAIDDLATIEAGRRPTRPVPVGLRQLLEACVGAHHPQAGDRALSLNLFCAPEIPATIVTDGAHLRQILLILIANAVQHTEHGRISVTAWVEGRTIAFAVEDSGPGIGSDRRETIFQPFADSGPPQLGTGLSLAIARRLAGMLEGTLTVESGSDGGARFVLRLPRQLPGVRLERRETHDDPGLRRKQWLERRGEALMAVDLALRMGAFNGAEVEDLADMARALARGAPGFGEDELGRRAAALEQGLRAGNTPASAARLAQDLLQAAA